MNSFFANKNRKTKKQKSSLPPVNICEHLQIHLSLSASFVLKSFPGWLMLLILPAVPVSPLSWILQKCRTEKQIIRCKVTVVDVHRNAEIFCNKYPVPTTLGSLVVNVLL